MECRIATRIGRPPITMPKVMKSTLSKVSKKFSMMSVPAVV